MSFSQERLQALKKEAGAWSNYCGGCETCSQHFGEGKFTMDPQELHELIVEHEESLHWKYIAWIAVGAEWLLAMLHWLR